MSTDWQTQTDRRYAQATISRVDELGAAAWDELHLTDRCTNCNERIDPRDDDDHVTARAAAGGYVIIGCEGYWQVDPNKVGITHTRWTPPPTLTGVGSGNPAADAELRRVALALMAIGCRVVLNDGDFRWDLKATVKPAMPAQPVKDCGCGFLTNDDGFAAAHHCR